MIELVAIVERRGRSDPRIRVRCGCCGDVYVTAQWPTNLPRAAACRDCLTKQRRRVPRGT